MAQIRRLSDQTVLQATSIVVEQMVVIGQFMILARLLGQVGFGTYQQMLLVVSLVGTVLGSISCQAVPYFLPRLDLPGRKAFMWESLLVNLVLGSVVAALLFVCAEPLARAFHNPELAGLLRIISFRLPLWLPTMYFALFALTEGRHITSTVYQIFLVSTFPLVVVLPVYLGFELKVVAAGYVLHSAVMAAISVVYLADYYRGTIAAWSRKHVVENLRYGGPLSFSNLIGEIGHRLDGIVVSSLLNPGMMGLYSAGARQVPLTSVVTMAISRTMKPRLVELHHQGRVTDMTRLWVEGVRRSVLVVVPAYALLLTFSFDVLMVLAGHQYRDAIWVFRIYLFLLLLQGANASALLSVIGEVKAIVSGTTLSILANIVMTVGLTWTLLKLNPQHPLIALIGPPAATVASTYLLIGYWFWRVRRALRVSGRSLLPWGSFVRIAVAAAAAIVPCVWLKWIPLSPWIRLPIAGLLYGLAFLGTGVAFRAFAAADRELFFRWVWRFARLLGIRPAPSPPA